MTSKIKIIQTSDFFMNQDVHNNVRKIMYFYFQKWKDIIEIFQMKIRLTKNEKMKTKWNEKSIGYICWYKKKEILWHYFYYYYYCLYFLLFLLGDIITLQSLESISGKILEIFLGNLYDDTFGFRNILDELGVESSFFCTVE